MSEIALNIRNKNKIMEEWKNWYKWGQVQFLFYFIFQSPHFEIPKNEM